MSLALDARRRMRSVGHVFALDSYIRIVCAVLLASSGVLAQADPDLTGRRRPPGGSPGMDIPAPRFGGLNAAQDEVSREVPHELYRDNAVIVEHPIDPDTYICGQGDEFQLNFWGPQNLTLRSTVDAEGRLFIPRIGYSDIAGQTLRAAREQMRKAVARFFPRLQFDVSLARQRKFHRSRRRQRGEAGDVHGDGCGTSVAVLDRAGGILLGARADESISHGAMGSTWLLTSCCTCLPATKSATRSFWTEMLSKFRSRISP